MKKIIVFYLAKIALSIPYIRKFNCWYRLLGVHQLGNNVKAAFFSLIGDYDNIFLHNNAEINPGCFLVAKAKIEIGENSTLAYRVTVLTSANPNGPENKLYSLYPEKIAPVTLGNNVWIGANVTILPGVTIGDCSVVAAGSVVTKDIPSNVLAAGNPAVVKKQLIF